MFPDIGPELISIAAYVRGKKGRAILSEPRRVKTAQKTALLCVVVRCLVVDENVHGLIACT